MQRAKSQGYLNTRTVHRVHLNVLVLQSMGVTDIHVYFGLESGELVSSTSCSVLFCATRFSNHPIFLGPNSRPTPEVCKAPPQTGEQLQEHCVSVYTSCRYTH